MDEIVSLKLWGTPCFYKTDYLNRFQANKCLKWVMYCGIGLIIMTILESELGRMLASCTVVNKSLNHASHEKSLLVPEIVFRHTIGNKIWIVFASCWAEYLRDVIKWQDVSKHSNKDDIEWAKHNRVSAPYWKRFHFVFFDAFGRAWSLATVSLQMNYDRGIFFQVFVRKQRNLRWPWSVARATCHRSAVPRSLGCPVPPSPESLQTAHGREATNSCLHQLG